MLRLFRLSLVLMAAAAALAQAPAKPNLTGTWNVDLEKSNFGGLEVPQAARYLIRHLGAKVEMQYEQDGHITRVDVTPDGEEHVLETGPDTENLARVYWSGAVLVFEGRIRPMASSNAPPVKWTSRWSLSPDKKVLTIDRHIATEQGSVDQKVVFEKQLPQAKAQ
ncbi:MAG: hypothetical protein LAN70_18650 [Acidobacteriia bacterium]|nr:hypothetical protein [Terriglobia bacterium]